MRKAALAIACFFPTVAFGVGSEDDTPATPTQTTQTCENGNIWDDATKSCIAPRESRLDDDTLYRAAREFAYAGLYTDALNALRAMTEGKSDRVLTYLGFVSRKTGDWDAAYSYYAAALEKNPDNLLARSYLGMGLASEGKLKEAAAQLSEIRRRGGRGSWPETALRLAIENGSTTSY